MNFNNAEPIDIEKNTEKLKNDCPGLLLEDETIHLAFKGIRDKFFFTSHRILVRDKHGITGKRTEYKSCPYHSIKAFKVETAGSIDSDVELKVWAGGVDISIDFDKNKVDIFSIQTYLSHHVFAIGSVEELVDYQPPAGGAALGESSSSSKIIDYLAGDSIQLDNAQVEANLAEDGALVPQERVMLAYKCGRDMTICTSKRVIYLDKQGITGNRVSYMSLRYSSIKAYEVETAGRFLDRDATFTLCTNLSQDKRRISTDLRKGQCDIMEVLWFFNNMLLGTNNGGMPPAYVPVPAPQGTGDESDSLMTMFTDDMAQIDAGAANAQFHYDPCILQAEEVCEMAFKGRRDLVLFTNKRIVFVDKQGWSGKKVAFTSFPYTSIKVFQVETAGSYDKDAELGFYTEIWFDPPKCSGCENGCGNEEPTPGMSYIEFDINKHTTDILGLYRYLSAKVRQYTQNTFNPGAYPAEAFQVPPPSEQGTLGRILDFFGENMTAIDPNYMQSVLGAQGEMPVLGFDELVMMAFKHGRDYTLFTSWGIMDVDVQGLSGKKKEFRLIPYETIKHFSVESAGNWDRDSQLDLILGTPWLPQVKRDFRSGQVDIIAVQNVIASKILGPPGRPGDFANNNNVVGAIPDPGTFSQILAYLEENNLKIDPKPVEEKFKTEMPVLQQDETVELAYKCGRDMFFITNKRVMVIDVQGFSGKRLAFCSLPIKFINGFMVESASTLGRNVKCELFTSKVVGGISTDFGKKTTDIFEINNSLATKILRHTVHQL